MAWVSSKLTLPQADYEERVIMQDDAPAEEESFTDVYRVVYDDFDATEVEAANAANVPILQTVHPKWAGLYLLSKRARPVATEQGKVFDVHCRYSTETEEARSVGEDLSAQPPTQGWGFETYDEPTDTQQDDNLTPITNTINESLDPPVMKQTSILVYTIRRYYPLATTRTNIRDMLLYYQDTVNDEAFDGYPKDCVRIEHDAREVFRRGQQWWLVTHTLRYNLGLFIIPEGAQEGYYSGWNATRRNESFHYLSGADFVHFTDDSDPPKKVSRPQPIDAAGAPIPQGTDPILNVYAIYRAADFGALGLFTVPTPVWSAPP